MSYEDRAALVSVVEETYALIAQTLEVGSPIAIGAIRPEIVDQIRGAETGAMFTDPHVLRSLRQGYADGLDTILALQEALLNEDADQYDQPLADTGFPEGRANVVAFRHALAQFLTVGSAAGRQQHAIALLQAASAILQPLSRDGGLAVRARSLLDLVDAVRDELTART
jgi:hypothetical protein